MMNEIKKELTHDFVTAGGLTGKIFPHNLGGLQWVFSNKKGETLSIVLNTISYGHESGKFEVLASWWNNEVIGYRDFGQVQKLINQLAQRGKDEINQSN